jgi:uncharacterized protein YabE (DUF348 family)
MRGEPMRRVLAPLVQVIALALLVGAGAAYASLQRTTTVIVNGEARAITAFGTTVADALERADVVVGERDLVVPSPAEPLRAGGTITVVSARPLSLDIDGRGPQVVWTTAVSVDQALASLGVRAEEAYVSVSRSAAIPREGMALQVRTPRVVNIVADGREEQMITTALTVADALDEAEVKVGKRDLVSTSLTDTLVDGATIAITRVRAKAKETSQPVAFRTEVRKDASRFVGSRATIREGRPGVIVKKYEVRYLDGRRAGVRLIDKTMTVKPVSKIVVVGTKPAPKVPRDVATLNWRALAQCESSGRPTAVSPTGKYHGLYQFSLPTWAAVGGTGLPSQAPAAEQTSRAQKLFQIANWRTQWPVCGVRLFS